MSGLYSLRIDPSYPPMKTGLFSIFVQRIGAISLVSSPF